MASTQRPAPRIFVLSERTLYGNLGDLILNRVLVEHCAEIGTVVTLRGSASMPAVLDDVYRTRAAARLGPVALFRHIRAARRAGASVVICLNPGGYRGALTLGAVLRPPAYLVLWVAGIGLVRPGVSLGPFDALRSAFEGLATLITGRTAVRDRMSIEALPRWARHGLDLVPDLALLDTAIGDRSSADGPRATLLVSLRTHKEAAGAARERLRTHVQAVVGVARERGLAPAFLVQVDSDRAFMAELAQAHGARLEILDTADPGVVAQANAIYREAALVVTNRLHVGVFAAMNGCVPMALVHPDEDRKLLGMLADGGLDALSVDVAEAPQTLALRLHDVLDRDRIWRRRLRRKIGAVARFGARRLPEILAAPHRAGEAGRPEPFRTHEDAPSSGDTAGDRALHP